MLCTSHGAAVRVVYFSDASPHGSGAHLAAAVVWRGTPDLRSRPAARRGFAAWRGWLRGLVGPLGARLVRGSADVAPERVPTETEGIVFDASRRRLRVLGHAYALPNRGRALVLVVDEEIRAGTGPRIAVRTVPSIPMPPAAASRDAMAAMLTAAVCADPDVRALLHAGTSA